MVLHRVQRLSVVTLSLCLLIGQVACQPLDERPGAWLTGQPAEVPVSDWTFTDEIEEIFIETRPWYGIPHSTTIWCAELNGQLYIGSYGDQKKAWEKAIEHDPEARIKVAEHIYDVIVVPVRDPALNEAVDIRYNEKYDMVDVFGEEIPEWWYYRVEQPEAS